MGAVGTASRYILTGISAVYLMAFGSLYCQIPGLYGENGVTPVSTLILPPPQNYEQMLKQPSLVRFSSLLGVSECDAMELISIAGIVLSALSLLINAFQNVFTLSVLWMCYLSLYAVGGTFMHFQWDILLLETGALCVLLSLHSCRRLALALLRGLFFKLMFMSGVVKLTSMCPTWWGLTALDWHYESQCLPTVFSWFAHHLPPQLQRLSVVAVFVIEILLPFFFLLPLRFASSVASYAQIFLMISIALTGNYNFFNVLTVVLAISCLNFRTSLKGGSYSRIDTFVSLLALAAVGGFLTQVVMFSPKIALAFTTKELNLFLKYAVPVGSALCVLSVVGAAAQTLRKCGDARSALFACFTIGLSLLLSVLSAKQMSQLAPQPLLDDNVDLAQVERLLQPLELVNGYGLFRRMTGVGGRPEVILEATNDINREDSWKEYDFLYKPDRLDECPGWVAPHQPRLDWQMWFAALGTYQHNPWLLSLARRLLEKEPTVLALLQGDPFAGDRSPTHIRAQLYTYRYSAANTKGSAWWRRDLEGEYLPALTVEQLKKTLRTPTPSKSRVMSPLHDYVAKLRALVGQPEGFTFVCSLVVPMVVFRQLFRN